MNHAVKKGLGFWMLTALVVGNIIGAGIFLLPSSLAQYGSISLLAWVITAGGSLLLAATFATLSKMYPHSGGPYLYGKKGFGDFIGFLTAYIYWFAWCGGNAGMAVALVGYLSAMWPALNDHAAVYSPTLAFLCKAGVIWIVALINILGIRAAGFTQLIMTILKLIPLVLIAGVGLFYIHPVYFSHFNISGVSHWQALSGAITLTLWAFVGFESATVPVDSATHPADVPRATMLGTVITAVVYILCTVALMGIIPATLLQHSEAPFTDAANILFGTGVGQFIAVAAIISCFGALVGSLLVQVHVGMAAAKDKLFPQAFAKTGRFDTPTSGFIISALAITLILALTLQQDLVKQFTFIVFLSTFAYVVPYFISAIAEIVLLAKNPLKLNRRKLRNALIIAILASVYAFWSIVGAGVNMLYYGCMLLLLAFPLYAVLRWRTTQ